MMADMRKIEEKFGKKKEEKKKLHDSLVEQRLAGLTIRVLSAGSDVQGC